MDAAGAHPDDAIRQRHHCLVDLMIPVVKGWSTETSVQVTSLGIQVHGGMGFVEETGAAQHWRDSRITPIYEGTTGIQAGDLVSRKIARDAGAAALELVDVMIAVQSELAAAKDSTLTRIAARLGASVNSLRSCIAFIVAQRSGDPRAAASAAVPFLELLGIVTGGWQMARAALIASQRRAQGTGNSEFHAAKILTALFYADHVLTQSASLADIVINGSDAILQFPDHQF